MKRLRAGRPVPRLPFSTSDPLAQLGHELLLLSDTLNRREAELRRLFALVQTVEQGVSPDDVLNRVYEGFGGVIPYDRIGCAFLSADGAELTAYWARSSLGSAQLSVGYSRRLAGSSLESILQTNQPRIINDLEAYLKDKPESDSTRRIVAEGGRSSLTCPLIINQRPIGFLFFTSRDKNTYRDLHQAIFQQIANQLSVVIEKSRVFQQISHTAHHDALTGLPNRTLFFERLEQALESVQSGERLAVLCLDLDHFKRVNDTLGHSIGDQLLEGVADRLRDCVGSAGAVARLGGDEFAVIMASLDLPSDAAALATRIGETIRAPFHLDGHEIAADVSIGISLAPNYSSESQELLRMADVALYEAKNNGRGSYRFFRADMNERVHARLQLERDLRRALADGEFELHYQPVVNLRNDRIVALEALARWRHPDRGLIPPSEFIPVAEDTGLIAALGEWALRTACAEAAKWPDDVRVAVNVSTIQLSDKSLVGAVADAMRAARLKPGRLEIEVTESVFIENTAAILATLKELLDYGVTTAIDDFGTGFSSLSYLLTFPFRRIKIDRAFIAGLPDKKESRAIVRAVSQLARSLDIGVTAEGVETEQQLRYVRILGCTEMQGYLFSRPRPAAELHRLFLPPAVATDGEPAAADRRRSSG
ncbi:MAG TPA: EAL domain-containing protein [Roseiarcus sp.]|nr:EAL domain-containing protein [Roseiarcus sp.]